MAGVNKVILVGNLGRDPELRHTNDGTPVANFSLATTERWTKDGEKVEKTEWHRCTAWAKTAELVCEYLRKGSQVYVEGKLQTREWETQEGEQRATVEVNVHQVTFLGGGRDSGGGDRNQAPDGDDGFDQTPPSDPDLPF